MIAPWAHELLTFASLTGAGVWLVVQLVRVASPRVRTPGCARCEHNPIAAPIAAGPSPASGPSRGLRSKQLRVIG